MKHFKFLVLTLAMLASVCFISSCSDDDDKKDNGVAAQLVGTWKQSGSWGVEILTFEKNGTGIYRDEKDMDPFKWSLKGNTLILDYGGGDCETYQIISIDANCLVMRFSDEYDDEIGKWYKQ